MIVIVFACSEVCEECTSIPGRETVQKHEGKMAKEMNILEYYVTFLFFLIPTALNR